MEEKKEEVKKEKNKLGKSIFAIIAIVLFILCVVYIFKSIKANKNNTLPFVFGYAYSVVPTGSMEETIHVNDVVIIKKVDFSTIELDDIIVYFSMKDNIFIVHRVVGFYDDGSLITKGDNIKTNPVVDSDPDTSDSFQGVSDALFIGKVTNHGKFLGLGWLINHGRVFIFLAIVGIFIYLLISEFINISKALKEKNNDTNKESEDKQVDIEKERERLRLEVLEELKKNNQNKDK